MSEWIDFALTFDPATRRVDLALGDDGDLAVDLTPATPMLIAIGTDRRARPDDVLPTGFAELNRPSSLVERRGWAGDAVDAGGERIGSRLWLLDRAKESELSRLMCAEWTKEAMAWAEAETGTAATVVVDWVRKSVLGVEVTVDGRTLKTSRAV